MFRLETPGGGGYGDEENDALPPRKKSLMGFVPSGSVADYTLAQVSA